MASYIILYIAIRYATNLQYLNVYSFKNFKLYNSLDEFVVVYCHFILRVFIILTSLLSSL